MCILFTVEKRCSVVNVAQVWGHTTTWTGAHMSHDLDTDDDDDDDGAVILVMTMMTMMMMTMPSAGWKTRRIFDPV